MPKPADLLLCAECDEVYGTELKSCPSCTSHQAIPLSRVTGTEGVELITGRRRWPRPATKTA